VRTYVVKEGDINREWYVVDVEGKTLGRVASQIAHVLIGKHKPMYTPHLDNGDFVIVVNADKVRVTGRKLDQKMYYRYSGYPSGLKSISLRKQLEVHPDRVIWAAVRNMLPKGKLGRVMLKKLKVYAAPEHPHAAQQPKVLDL
jgi:large subunit ribosomal protein L13